MSANTSYRPRGELSAARSSPIRASSSRGTGHQRRRWYDPLRRVFGRQPEQELPNPHHGDAYNATHHNHASVTTIQHASSITMVNQGPGSDDFLLLGELPRHPDVSGEWNGYVDHSRDTDMREIWGWIDSRKRKELIMWVHGARGIGKSTLARSLKDDARSLNRLAAAIFLSRLPTDSWGPETLIRLIAGEIGRTHHKAVPAIARAIRQCHAACLQVLVECFIRDPLLALQLPYPLILIIDGFGKCSNHYELIQQLSHLTPYSSLIRFIVLSRPEPRDSRFKGIPIRSFALAPVSVDAMAEYLEGRFDAIDWEEGGRPTSEDVLRLAYLSNGLFTRMEEVTSIFRDLVPSNCELSEQIFDLAWSAKCRFDTSKTIEELDHLILLDRVALALRPLGHLDRHDSLFCLAHSLYDRFKLLAFVEDLDGAVSLYKDCLALRPSGHPSRGAALDNLGVVFWHRFSKSRTAGDLEEAIQLHREALDIHPPGHEGRHHSCNNLSVVLHDRYTKDRSVGDLDEAISLGREALLLRPQGHEHRFKTVDALRIYLEDRFETKGAVEDLQEAIQLAEEAVSTCPAGDPHYAILPGELAYYRKELARVQALSDHRFRLTPYLHDPYPTYSLY